MESESRLPQVLFVIGSLAQGGSERQLVALIEAAHGSRFSATVAVLEHSADNRHESRLEALGVPVVALSGRRARLPRAARAAGSLRRLVVLMLRRRPDVVYSWLEEATLLAAPVARLLRVPVVVARRNISGPYDALSGPLVRAIHRAERLAALVTVNCRAVGAEAERRGIAGDRVRVVRNGCRLPEVGERSGSGPVRIGYLARMRPEKGHMRLLRALAHVDATANWRVEIAGDGELDETLRRAADRLGLRERVRFVGPVADGALFWGDQDVAVLLSDHEGSPNALIEAAAAGLPIVGTAVGGVPELVDDEVGALVDPGDDRGIAMAIERLVRDPALRASRGAGARERAESRYSLDAFVQGHCAVLDEVADIA